MCQSKLGHTNSHLIKADTGFDTWYIHTELTYGDILLDLEHRIITIIYPSTQLINNTLVNTLKGQLVSVVHSTIFRPITKCHKQIILRWIYQYIFTMNVNNMNCCLRMGSHPWTAIHIVNIHYKDILMYSPQDNFSMTLCNGPEDGWVNDRN